jgi:hypothetical protein
MITMPKLSLTQGSLAAILSLLIASATHSADLLNFRDLHNQYLDSRASEIQSMSLSGRSDEYYYFNYYLHGMLSAVEATQDDAMLRNVMRYIDNMISKSIVSNGLRVWPPIVENGWPVNMYSYKSCSPIARAAAVIMQNPTFRSKYAADAARYITFVDESIIQFWHIGVYETKIPWLPEDLGGWGSYLYWSDNASALGQIAALLYSATRNAPTARTSIYLDIATRIAQGFKRKLQPRGTGWTWDNGTAHPESGQNTQLVPDTSHANDDARLIVFTYEAGVVFTLDDVQRMANTLSDIIWNGSLDDPMFANYINGANTLYRNNTAWSNGSVYHGWSLLGKYSSKAQTALSYLLKAVVEGKQNPSVDVNRCCGYGPLALSGDLLRNSGVSLPPPPPQKPSAPINLVVTPAK